MHPDFRQLDIFSCDHTQPEKSVDTSHLISKQDLESAAELRKKATSMQAEIDNKRFSPTSQQTLTARRLRIARSMEAEADLLEVIQSCIFGLAELLEAGQFPRHLRPFTTRGFVARIKDAIATSPDTLGAQLLEIGSGHNKNLDPVLMEKRRIRETERDIAFQSIPGYFPSPPAVVKLILENLELTPGVKVLEPSAGGGAIASALLSAGAIVDTVEINSKLAELLQLRGFSVQNMDFLKFKGDYPRIAMNPDFARCGDIIHVHHAYGHCLSKGGILVSVMSSGSFSRSGKTELDFQRWVRSVGGQIKKIPEKAFLKSDVPTGVETKLLVVRKN